MIAGRASPRDPLLLAAAGLVVVLACLALLTPAASPRQRPAVTQPQFSHRQAPSGGPAFASVPPVLETTVSSARAALAASRFHVRVVTRIVPRLAPGLVIAMRPAPGALVPSEATIVLVVSRQPASATGPP
ncbi:MAG TPA: PASTA domain-containing protein [Gaiellales bacterium]|nr:PASTA domain-containing protein [Gaiellales bacterium]